MTMPTGPPGGVDDGQVVDVPGDHLEEHLEGQRVDPAGHRVGRHHPGDADARVDACGEHAGAQVAVGQDAGEPLAVHDQQGRHPVLRHHLRGLVHRGARRDRHRLPADEVAHPGLEDCATRGRQLQRGDGAAHPAGPLGVEEGVDLGVVLAQPVEVGCGQEQGQGVLDRRDVEGRRVALGQAGRTEARALAPAVDQGPLGVADLRGTRPQHVEVEVVAAPFDQSRSRGGSTRRTSAAEGCRARRPGARRTARGARGSHASRRARRRGPCPHRGSAGSAAGRVESAGRRWHAERPGIPRRTGTCPGRKPRPVPPAAGMRLRAAAGGAREEGGEP